MFLRAAKAGRRVKAQAATPACTHRGVGQWHSTDESFEQSRAFDGGEWGGKAADQGERPSTAHAPDTERGRRVTGVDGCAESSKGT